MGTERLAAEGRRSVFTSPSSAFVVALIAIRVVIVLIAIHNVNTRPLEDPDVHRFQQIAGAAGTPYRDYPVEYMPGELLAIKAVAAGTLATTAVVLAITAFALDLGVFAALRYGWNRDTAARYLLFGTPLLTFIYLRLDFLPVSLTVLGFALARRGRHRWAGVALGLAVLTKIWPALLLPVLMIERRWKTFWWSAAVAAAGIAAWLAVGGLAGPRAVLSFRGAVGWEVESTIGLGVWVVSRAHPALLQGASRVGRAPAWAGPALLVALAAAAAAIWTRSRRWGGDLLGAPALGALGALLALSPLFSLQYVAWLLPWVAIAAGERRARIPAYLALSAIVLTAALSGRSGSTHGWIAWTQVLIFVRDASCVGLAVWWLLPARSPASLDRARATQSTP